MLAATNRAISRYGFKSLKDYESKRVDDMLAESFAVWQSKTILARS